MSRESRSRAQSSSYPTAARPRLRNQILFVLGIIVLAAGAFYTALVVATQIDHIFFPDSEIRLGGPLARLPGIESGESSDIGGGRINILVMGVDRRPHERDLPTRTDTMFVMTVDPTTHTARGLAMPRDLYVDIPSRSGNSTFKDRINTAYLYGENNNYPGGGSALVKQVVERLLGIQLHYYVIIDFEGFKQIIDMLGGVDVEVQTPVNDPYYSETERLGDYYPCVFAAGKHHMNGSDALCFARTRYDSDDRERILRQQRIMLAVMDKVTELHVLADVTNVVNLWKRYKETIKTDIGDVRIPGFARLAASIDPEQMAFLSLAPATTGFTTSEGAQVLIADSAGIKTIVDAFVSDSALQNENAVIEVQNGTGIQGHATKAMEYFVSLGIPVDSVHVANAATEDHSRTEIINFGGKPYTAERLAGWMGLARNRVRTATENDHALRTTDADIVVILGTDAKLESAVAQEIR